MGPTNISPSITPDYKSPEDIAAEKKKAEQEALLNQKGSVGGREARILLSTDNKAHAKFAKAIIGGDSYQPQKEEKEPTLGSGATVMSDYKRFSYTPPDQPKKERKEEF